MNKVDFYFSIGSTYTYLAVTRILDVEKNIKFILIGNHLVFGQS